jgi:hypothetical protein
MNFAQLAYVESSVILKKVDSRILIFRSFGLLSLRYNVAIEADLQ